MSEFTATISFVDGALIPSKRQDGSIVKREINNSSTNDRILEVMRLFDTGRFRVSSIDEVIKLSRKETIPLTYRVEINTGNNLDIQEVIERFNAIFVFKGISEVGKN